MKKIVKKIINIFKKNKIDKIFGPSFNQIYDVSEKWDEDLNFLIDNVDCKFSEEPSDEGGPYTIIFYNIIHVWIKNYPYAYGSPLKNSYLPKKETVIKLRELEIKLKSEKYEQSENDNHPTTNSKSNV